MSEPARDPAPRPAARKRVVLLGGDAERRRLIAEHAQAVLVSEELPLRANLSVVENITTVLQYRTNTYIGEANDTAWQLLTQAGYAECAALRDPELSSEQRFIAKLLRAVVLTPPLVLIDRPAMLLPDTHYPHFLNRVLLALEGRFEQCWILDYAWNAPLYNSRT